MKKYSSVLLIIFMAVFALTGCQTTPPKVEDKVVVAPPPPPVPAPTAPKVVVNFRDVYFDYNMYNLSSDAKRALKHNADGLTRDPDLMITIAGHCDERGTNEYNISLGHRRANEVKRYLKGLGIDQGRVRTISYGEEQGVCSQASESCWQKNRRAQFIKN